MFLAPRVSNRLIYPNFINDPNSDSISLKGGSFEKKSIVNVNLNFKCIVPTFSVLDRCGITSGR